MKNYYPTWQTEFIEKLKKDLVKYKKLEDPVFIILIPGSLHLADLCIRHLPKRQNIILLLNNLSEWEHEWAKSNLVCAGLIHIQCLLDHPVVLNVLFEVINIPFGVMDYDCYLTNKNGFQQFRSIEDNSLGNVVFSEWIDELGFYLPHTHAMFFNTPLLIEVMKKYDVDCRRIAYKDVSAEIKTILQTLGINEKCLPEKDFNFDTLKLVILLAMTEGKEFSRIEHPENPIAFHIGCASNPERFDNRWRKCASYFWQKALAANNDKSLELYYHNQFPYLPSIKYLKESIDQDCATKADFFWNVEKVLTNNL